jgi:hypothetical protein
MSISTPEQIKKIYLENFGREPTPQELGHHASNKTGLEHIQQWASQNRTTPNQTNQTNQVGLSTILTGMLRDFQKFNSSDRYTRLYQQSRELQEAQGMRAISPVAGSATLSPSQRATIRSGSASALQPQVTASADVIRGAQAASAQFLDSIQVARSLGQDIETLNEKKRERALDSIKFAASAGTPLDESQLAEVSSLTGYSPDMIQGYFNKAKELADYETQMNQLDMQKTKADIARTWDLINDNGETPIDETDYRDILYSVGLPTNIATTKGEITKGSLDKLVNAGLPSDTAQGIYDAITQGYTLEEIRQWLKQKNADPAILDTFMQTLQGEDKTDEIDNLINQYLG